MSYSIYAHKSPSGKVYIGQTCQTVNQRWRKNGVGYYDSPALKNAISKYGWGNLSHEVLFTVENGDEANRIEALLVNVLRTTNKDYGYNVRDGGGNRGRHSKESIKKMSDAKKGIKFTPEHCKNISISKSGKNNPNYGKPCSETRKHNIGVANGKTVLQYTMDGELVGKYYSACEAGRITGINSNSITRVCRGERPQTHGFVWKYEEGGERICQ